MKTACSIFGLLISFASFSQQSDFTVAPGAQRTLNATERTLSLKNFNLGDDCTIIIPPFMDGWTVTATDVTIGRNVRILGTGSFGGAATNGSHGMNGANCMPGGNGMNGNLGLPGGAGKNISLTLRIRKIESLAISVNGGDGGPGGNGGNGGKGGNATCTCNGGTGGNAGSGGRGGPGGRGGNVNISYSSVGSATVSNSNFVIQNIGGRSGIGGVAGVPGAGGLGGGCSDPKALVKLAGAAGRPGAQGSLSIQGANGLTSVQSTDK